jgi:hypothetical protein
VRAFNLCLHVGKQDTSGAWLINVGRAVTRVRRVMNKNKNKKENKKSLTIKN